MAGHSAIRGDRFSLIEAAKASCAPLAKTLYYPLSPPQNDKYNPARPSSYNPKDLPMRTQQGYWNTINRLAAATTKKAEATITRETGVSRLPLCAASPAFIHPTFFPMDPFHLFYENCMAFLWDTMTGVKKHGPDPIHLSQAERLGALIPLAMETLPPSFSGPIRDIYLKRNSQYKIYEFMAVCHWYFIPIAIELSFNSSVLANFARFVEAIEFAMTTKPRSLKDLSYLQNLIADFLTNYERLYIGENPEKIIRSRLCIFQLIHIPIHIQWNGSIRLGSQATVERAIGEEAHKIRSKKSPFSNLANIIYRRELFRILLLYYPELLDSPKKTAVVGSNGMQAHRIAWTKVKTNSKLSTDLRAISAYLGQDVTQSDPSISIQRWGKLKFHSSRSPANPGTQATPSKQTSEGTNLLFGHAHAFYTIKTSTFSKTLVVYTPLCSVKTIFRIPRGSWGLDGSEKVLDVLCICNLVGIWVGVNTREVYILRKHPGLDYLTTEERGVEEDSDAESGDENE
ncbi:hypothetical protein CPB83DRAFT_915758 [Crepidotus variabilis]|uniref:Uncharacterized protein n=1 Tax=Crepidotus variabilis TaxID=179855 RepID=A0A9P6EMD0_9AGAR|nr:hypothetical protein CPB83DRAFT_915758 [Crepidotus variabilis]